MMAKILEAIKGLSAKYRILVAVAAVALLVVILLAAYFALQHDKPKPAPVQVQAPPPPPPPPPAPVPEPEPPVVEAPPAAPPLPLLAESDSMVLEALAGVAGDPSLLKLLQADRVIRNIVATVDNLPGRQAPLRVRPFKRTPGQFLVAGGEGKPTVSKKNAARYEPYVKVAETTDTRKLVELYIRLYPLFQQAYEELGYPKKYFNDRLLVVLDDLLAAPDIQEPVRLVQPKVFYLYADPELEGRSMGQRILMRTGSRNEAILKAKLGEFKRELLLHVRDGKLADAGAPAASATAVVAKPVPAVK